MGSDMWCMLHPGTEGGPAFLGVVTTDETGYLLGQSLGEPLRLWSMEFSVRGVVGLTCVGDCPVDSLLDFGITIIGRYILVLAEGDPGNDQPLSAIYSTVSGEWSMYRTLSGRPSRRNGPYILSLCHIGQGVVLLLESSATPFLLSATVPLPCGDDYESAGRWNVLDPDHN
ncbi:hypothetical protein KIPB_008204 [Kipferlia bialata]|uniref:Uncharacterized protein n=1 Tax=Kipferlia bialata TaxID=797122 RepID=A0A391NN23_9EUKA|nr:hypothetical protein KIPB_008204 [Kipferlia bialata]|eukprot:g8204.t1